MQNYNQQQQSVILKGIAQNILQMNVPTFEQANKLFKEFLQIITPMSQDIWIVITTQPMDEFYYIQLPFIERQSGCYFSYRIFYTEKEAIDFASLECGRFHNNLKGTSIGASYGGDQHYQHKIGKGWGAECNGRKWMVEKNPVWISAILP